MFRQIVGKALAGIFLTGLFSAGVQAVDEPVPMKQVDRSKLSESFRNTGQQGGTFALGSQGYVARENGSMTYPYIYTGSSTSGSFGGRDQDYDNSKGQGVWILARDASGNTYVTSSGPVSNTGDVEQVVPDLTPGSGNLRLRNGQDPPIVAARLGYDTQDANVWFNTDRGGITEQPKPISEEPVEVDNYRENGSYTLPRFDHFPEETVITKWRSNTNIEPDGTGMTITRTAYGWSHPDFDDFFFVELVIENTSNRSYEEVYMGYLNYFSVNKPGHSYRKWNGYWFSEPGRRLEDDRYQFTEAANYGGKYQGKKISYQFDGDAPTSSNNDMGEPRFGAEAIGVIGHRAEQELYSPQYIGWGPVDVTPPFINDPDVYVSITGTAMGGEDIPISQPAYAHWWKRRSRTNIEFEPHVSIDTVEEIWKKFITPGKPYDDNPIEGGPSPGERELQEQLHSQMFGPWKLTPGDKAKIVIVFAAGMAAENAGPGGEPMDFRIWAMTPGAQSQVPGGEDILFNHIDRARQLYAMGFDLPNQPPDVESIARAETDRPVLLRSNANGNVELSWSDGADDAVHPDYSGGEAQDVAGYKVYGNTALIQTDPVQHAGAPLGPWNLIAMIQAKDPSYYDASTGIYTFADENSITGFGYRYNIVTYANGHANWENTNAQKNAISGAQMPVPTTLADLPPVVQNHIREGTESSHIVTAARHNTSGGRFTPVVAASDGFDALDEKVFVVPNPWKDDGLHSFGAQGDNNKRMRFTNLPRLARISIFTAAGDLVMEIVHDGTRGDQHTAEVSWSQRSRSGTSYASPGIYFFAVESLVPGQEGKVQTGSFLIIQ